MFHQAMNGAIKLSILTVKVAAGMVICLVAVIGIIFKSAIK
jgi:hypothetical protein